MRRLSSLLRLAAVAAALGGRTAVGQVIDTYLPAYGSGLDSTVTSRPQPEYDASGVNVGSFVIRPMLRESAGFDSNIDGVPGGHGSALIETQASLSVASDWERNSLRAALNVDQANYLSRPLQDETDWSASIGGTYVIGNGKLDAAYSHLALTEREGEIGAVNLVRPLPFAVEDVRLGYTISDVGHFSFTPNLDLRSFSFGSQMLSNGFAADIVNRTVAQAELVSRYEAAPGRDVVLVLRGTRIDYTHLPAGTINADSLGATVLAGVDYAAGVFRYRVLVGYQLRDYVSRAISGLSAPSVEASVIWSPTRLTTLTLTLRNDIEDAADQNVTGFTYTAGRLSLDHEYRRNVVLNGFVDVQHGDLRGTGAALGASPFAQLAGTQDIYAGGLGATLLLNRNMRLSARYVLGDHLASGVGSYLENTVVVALEFRL